ncbi:MAG: sugar ABC transporter ATP-binding protein, partial [Caldilineaceae bacterium]|nr:sugar ABC transporter ATP-binding protein [Caldilineaceae bacterium]
MADDSMLLTMKGISKTFPGVQALDNVDFSLQRGEIHALLGENGAGKSTLIKVLTGVERQNAGVIELEGREILAKSPHEAQTLGISTVYQEVNLCPNLSVAENILLGREPHRFGGIDWRRLNARASEIMTWLDVDIDVKQSLGMYPVAVQQMVAISRALEISARVLILDEPTSSLAAHETAKLFAVMRKLKHEGMSVIFITHFLDQVYEISDRITVLRNGRLVGTYTTAGLPRVELIARMIGRDLTELEEMDKFKQAGGRQGDQAPVLQARDYGRVGAIDPFNL